MSSPETAAPSRPIPPPLRAVVVVGLLYLFLVGISVLEGGISSLGEDIQESLFTSFSNPLAGLFVGILATVLVQSSSVTTSTVVGLVGTGVLSIDDAVPVVMGANIGTTVTSTLAALGHVRRPHEFRGAFAAATVHDSFNVLTVAVILPLELATGFLSNSAEWLSKALVGQGGATFESPLKKVVEGPSDLVLDLWGEVTSGTVLGVALIITAMAMIFVALGMITKNMRLLVADRIERSVSELLQRGGGYAGIVIGLIITIAVQSSSITTSVMVPLAAAGVISVHNVYPMALGANVGTTTTAALAAMAASSPDALTIAFVHTLFNVAGIVVFYVVPVLRPVPVAIAERVADIATRHRTMVLAYVVIIFIAIPALGVFVLR